MMTEDLDIVDKMINGRRDPSMLTQWMEMHGERRYIANTAPGNEASQALFKSLGFKLCQFTFAKEVE